MNKELSNFLGKFNQLCSECENWTTGTCDFCSHSVCDECADDHLDGHDEDEE